MTNIYFCNNNALTKKFYFWIPFFLLLFSTYDTNTNLINRPKWVCLVSWKIVLSYSVS